MKKGREEKKWIPILAQFQTCSASAGRKIPIRYEIKFNMDSNKFNNTKGWEVLESSKYIFAVL